MLLDAIKAFGRVPQRSLEAKTESNCILAARFVILVHGLLSSVPPVTGCPLSQVLALETQLKSTGVLISRTVAA